MAKNAQAATADRRRLAREQQLRQAAADKKRRTMIQVAVIGGVAVVVIAIIATAVIIGSRDRGSTTAGPGVPSADTTVTVDNASVPFAVSGSAVRVGPADAKVKIDLWVDYSCPHCQEFEAENNATINQLIAGGKVAVSYHNIQIVTDYGTQAGGAAACVATLDSDQWTAFNSALYANHSATTDGWSRTQFRDFAQQQGVNAEAQTCIADGRYTGWIATNTADAAAQQVESTPTMMINGQKTETLTGQGLIKKVNELVGQ